MSDLLSRLNGVDYTLLFSVGVGLIVGTRKGLAVMIGKILALLGTMMVVLYFYSSLASLISVHSFLPLRTTEVMVFVLLGIVSWLALSILLKLLGKVMEVKFAETLSRLGGFLLGGIWFYGLSSFVLYALLAFQIPFMNIEWMNNSAFADFSIRIPVTLYQLLLGGVPNPPSV